MRQTTYRMTLNDGMRVDESANSAGEAIEAARRKYRGRTVVKCYSGLTDREAADINAVVEKDQRAYPGLIHHEIPAHEPIAEGAVVRDVDLAPRRLKSDATTPMFDDAAIRSESDRARSRDLPIVDVATVAPPK